MFKEVAWVKETSHREKRKNKVLESIFLVLKARFASRGNGEKEKRKRVLCWPKIKVTNNGVKCELGAWA